MRRIIGFGVIWVVVACAAPEPPRIETPESWQEAESTAGVWPSQDWWQGFGSDELNQLIATAADNNRGLKAAVARILQAEAQAKVSGAATLPSVSAGGSLSRSDTDFSNANRPNAGATTRAQATLQASYQLDLFGQARANAASAAARVESSLYDRETVSITLLSDVATTYLQILAVRDRIRLAEERLKVAEDLLKLVEAQRRIGTISDLELAQQRAAIATQRAAIPALRVSERQSLDALAVLLGRLPQGFDVTARTLSDIGMPAIAAGLPSELLARRPDLRKTESDLRANGFDVAAARAARLPSIQLTAQGGTSSGALDDLFTSGTFFNSLAASLTAPVFLGNRLEGQEQAAAARRLELIETYRQNVLSAFRDVEDALSAARENAVQYGFAREAHEQSLQAYRLAELRYRAGTVNFQTVLDAQRGVLQSQEALVQSALGRFNAVIGLTQALGGGWDGAVPERLDLAIGLAAFQ
ncbi:MAG: efflux transporter outer membrane subunit [Rhodospirillaceae bacterium]|nr:efflux transporter outer membrane subunit [Rhodospirillaceae bacterium]